MHSEYCPIRLSTSRMNCWYRLKLGMERMGTFAQVITVHRHGSQTPYGQGQRREVQGSLRRMCSSEHMMGIAISYRPKKASPAASPVSAAGRETAQDRLTRQPPKLRRRQGGRERSSPMFVTPE